MENQDSKYNKQAFADLLTKAMGNRTMTKFAEDAGMSVAHISRMANKKLEAPPSPETIKRLFSAGSNGVTYEDFMIAAGHITETVYDQIDFIEEYKIEKLNFTPTEIKEKSKVVNPLISQGEIHRLESMCTSVLLSKMNLLPYKWKMEGNQREKDFMIQLIDAPVDNWMFEFKMLRLSYDEIPNRNISPHFVWSILGRLAIKDIPTNTKYTIATTNNALYYSLTRRYPKNLDINLSIMLIDIDKFIIIKEEYVSYNHKFTPEQLENIRLADME